MRTPRWAQVEAGDANTKENGGGKGMQRRPLTLLSSSSRRKACVAAVSCAAGAAVGPVLLADRLRRISATATGITQKKQVSCQGGARDIDIVGATVLGQWAEVVKMPPKVTWPMPQCRDQNRVPPQDPSSSQQRCKSATMQGCYACMQASKAKLSCAALSRARSVSDTYPPWPQTGPPNSCPRRAVPSR